MSSSEPNPCRIFEISAGWSVNRLSCAVGHRRGQKDGDCVEGAWLSHFNLSASQ